MTALNQFEQFLFYVVIVVSARYAWLVASLLKINKLCEIRGREIEALERQIIIERFKCAASNPDAAAILTEWEEARKRRMKPEDLSVYHQFFDKDLGGRARNVVLSAEVAEAERWERQ